MIAGKMTIPLDVEVPDSVLANTLEQAAPAVERLRALLPAGPFPPGVTRESLAALLAVLDGVARAAREDKIDLTPSEAASRLRMARPSVMRLIARGDLLARKSGGHYVVSPRDLRLFQARLTVARAEALRLLADMDGA